MTIQILLGTSFLTLAIFTTGYPQTFDKAKLDQYFDRLAEKNKAMGTLLISKDDNVLYSRSVGALRDRITSRIGLSNTYIATGNIDVNRNESLTYRHAGGTG